LKTIERDPFNRRREKQQQQRAAVGVVVNKKRKRRSTTFLRFIRNYSVALVNGRRSIAIRLEETTLKKRPIIVKTSVY